MRLCSAILFREYDHVLLMTPNLGWLDCVKAFIFIGRYIARLHHAVVCLRAQSDGLDRA
jgi:hypothetical protein